MNIAHERLVNGLLKGFGGQITPEHVRACLSQDVEIVVPPDRANGTDLWPAIWALAAILERELYGKIYIRCGLTKPLAAPSPLGSRCQFVDQPHAVALSIGLGAGPPTSSDLVADARRTVIAVGETFKEHLETPTAIECFVLAGFLGFAAIAHFTGIPEHRIDFATSTFNLSYDPHRLARACEALEGFTTVGVGQVGQAMLALMFFLHGGQLRGRRIALVDDDQFQDENGRTQLLLAENGDWVGKDKTTYLAPILSGWGADVEPFREKIHWSWRRAAAHPGLALLGLHDLEGRRMACAAGFERILEAGVGTNLLRPRITWHSLPGEPSLGRQLFPDSQSPGNRSDELVGGWVDELKGTPGSCGWVEFMGISATAPCLGAAAAGLALAELGAADPVVSGSAMLWSQCIAPYRKLSQ